MRSAEICAICGKMHPAPGTEDKRYKIKDTRYKIRYKVQGSRYKIKDKRKT